MSDRPPHDPDPPRPPRGEQLVRVDLALPAEEVPLRIIGGAAFDGEPGHMRALAAAGCELLAPALRLFGCRSLGVSLRHGCSLPEMFVAVATANAGAFRALTRRRRGSSGEQDYVPYCSTALWNARKLAFRCPVAVVRPDC